MDQIRRPQNTAALATEKIDNALKAIPSAREWSNEFQTGQFRDDSGNNVTRAGFGSSVRMSNPKESGIGISTSQRAIITDSAIRAFERGGTSANVLEAARSGVDPAHIPYSAPADAAEGEETSHCIRQARNPKKAIGMPLARALRVAQNNRKHRRTWPNFRRKSGKRVPLSFFTEI